MVARTVLLAALASAAVAAPHYHSQSGVTQTAAPHTSDAPAGDTHTVPAIPTAPGTLPPRRSSDVTGVTTHGPFSGSPTTIGALKAPTTLSKTIAPLPPNPTHTYYNADGLLRDPAPVPYQPYGGLGTNGTQPRYQVNSDFDFQSLTLALYQEWIELDLFNHGLAVFSEQDFLNAGLTAEDRALIQFMAVQETGHATLISNMIGEAAPPQCVYDYPWKTVREFVDFNQRLTTFGEASVLGFINHLDAREVGQLISQTIAVESRQQTIFRQMLGLHPMPVWFASGIPQSWAWTFLAPYISWCPQNTTRLTWQNFPTLHIVNNPNPNRVSANKTQDFEFVGQRPIDPANSTLPEGESCLDTEEVGKNCSPGITRNRTEPLSFPGREVRFTWDNPGLPVGPNNSYITDTTAGEPAFVAWVSQLNLTYTPLHITGQNEGYAYQPTSVVFEGDPAANSTMFVALTDLDLFVTPFNISLLNPHIRALGVYQAG